MPTWKLYKGENKTFEGTVLIATSAGMTPTNYNITGATMGFDMGSIMGDWMIRTDSLYGSMGTNTVYNPSFTAGTSGWGEVSGDSNSISTLSNYAFLNPFTSALIATTSAGTHISIEDVGTGIQPKSRGSYFWSVNVALLSGNNGTFTGIAIADLATTFSPSKSLNFDWQTFYGTGVLGTSVKTGPILDFYLGQLSKHLMITNINVKRIVAVPRFQIMPGTMGVYRYSFLPEDTENLAATSYYFDIWLRNTSGNEYTITVGTLGLLPVIGTF